jgi:hypothetical protein
MKLVVKIALGIVLAFVVMTAGCAALIGTAAHEATKKQGWTVKISAPAGYSWSGHVGDHSIDGTGDHEEKFDDMAITAAVVQKSSDGDWTLGVALYDQDGNRIDSAQTSADFGIATVDGSDF